MYALVCADYSPFSSLFCHHHSDQISRPDRFKIESALNTEQYATCRDDDDDDDDDEDDDDDDDDDDENSQCVRAVRILFFVAPFRQYVSVTEVSPDSIEYQGSSTIFEMLVCITAPKPRTPLVRKPSFWFLICVKCIKQHQR